jgi:hypothetical protein
MFLTIIAASLVPAVDGKAAAPTSENDRPRSWFRQEDARGLDHLGPFLDVVAMHPSTPTYVEVGLLSGISDLSTFVAFLCAFFIAFLSFFSFSFFRGFK